MLIYFRFNMLLYIVTFKAWLLHDNMSFSSWSVCKTWVEIWKPAGMNWHKQQLSSDQNGALYLPFCVHAKRCVRGFCRQILQTSGQNSSYFLLLLWGFKTRFSAVTQSFIAGNYLYRERDNDKMGIWTTKWQAPVHCK